MHVSAGDQGGQKRESDYLVLYLQAVVSYLIWVLGTELRSPGRARRILKLWARFPAPPSVLPSLSFPLSLVLSPSLFFLFISIH